MVRTEAAEDAVPDYRQMLSLAGRAFLVLGAGRGIGRQAAHAVRQAGADVMCADRDEARGRAVAAELGAGFVGGDATRPEAVAAMFDAARDQFGRVDGVIDIIGGSAGAAVPELEPEAVASQFALNLTHALLVTQAAATALTHGGSVSFVGSIAGLASIPRQAVYGAAKAALHHFVRCAAAELGHRGIRVNAVAPGFVRTPRMVERFGPEDWDELIAATPLQRVAEPAEIAGPLLFLASELASYVTGQVLVADGGMVGPLRAMRHGSALQLSGLLPSGRTLT